MNTSNFKTVLVQYSPIYKEVDANIVNLEKMLSIYTKEDNIDVVLFPEMALTGYIFDSKEDIEMFTDEFNQGTTFDFCNKLAKRLNCYVICGYAEKSDTAYYNSAMIVNREGIALPSYRKHFLYPLDTTWAVEGESFGYIEIETHFGKNLKIGLGICMDIDPYEYKSPFEKMEFSSFCKSKNVDLILFLTNWPDGDHCNPTPYDYWIKRMGPFLNNNESNAIYFLAANRIGRERELSFVGGSCVIKVYNNSQILQNLSNIEENTLLVNINL